MSDIELEEIKLWLVNAFHDVSYSEEESVCTARLPGVYFCLQQEMSEKNHLYVAFKELVGKGPTEPQSYINLFNKIAHLAFEECMTLYKHIPKEGQDNGILKDFEFYRAIRRFEPEHKHGSPDLMDFNCIEHFYPFRSLTIVDFSTQHMHLLVNER